MYEKLLDLDKNCFIYLNGLGSQKYDEFWLFITQQINWLPLFLLLAYFTFKKLGTKQSLYLVFFVAVLIATTDQVTNLFKNGFMRLRPCDNLQINTFIRVVQVRHSFSFFSGHAANTMAVAIFLFLNLRNRFRYFGFIFLWPLVFAYSRIYLGLHYPSDILAGYFFGFLNGFLFFKLYQSAQQKYFRV